MASILLVFAIAAFAVVIFWYVLDEVTRDGQGRSGLLGMSDDHSAKPSDANQGWNQVTTGNRPWRVRRH